MGIMITIIIQTAIWNKKEQWKGGCYGKWNGSITRTDQDQQEKQ